ncbi:YDG/SRA domain-containing protein [Colletotrichum higginsianum]|nr:YDG/SRA domain-containing protein [Colletotrichum higginsianum]
MATPPTPSGQQLAQYFGDVKGKGLIPLEALARANVSEKDSRVLGLVRKASIFLNYAKRCELAFPAAVPRDLFNAKYPLKSCLVKIFSPASPSVQKKYFSEKMKTRAKELHEWADRVEDSVGIAHKAAQEAKAEAKAAKPVTNKAANGETIPPPADHEIWGRGGIMHGLALRPTDRFTVALNPVYTEEKRPANVYGHNGLTVGDWFPNQLSALFNGAHGSSNAGIYFQKDEGAFSVIVAGAYQDLDVDKGEIIFYSGSNSHLNDDSESILPSTEANKSLAENNVCSNPVRVLRKAHKGSRWAPSHGYRYDGLYEVYEKRLPKNTKNGTFEQYHLVRLPGQTPLRDLRSNPSAKQISDLAKSRDRY